MESDPDTGELDIVGPGAIERSDPDETQQRILAELQSIRYRLGVLVFWFVALPIIGGLIAWIVISFSES